MANDKAEPDRSVSIVEIIVALVVSFFAATVFTAGTAFSGFWTHVSIAVVSSVFAVIAIVQSRRLTGVILIALALLIAVTNSPTVRKMFPLQDTVNANEFRDAKVAEVLLHIAKSNDEFPTWRFHVSTQRLAYSTVSMTIRPNATLEETLDELMVKSGAQYEWNWHKHCGNCPSPLCASFYVTTDDSIDQSDYDLLISRYEIFDSAAFNEEHERAKP